MFSNCFGVSSRFGVFPVLFCKILTQSLFELCLGHDEVIDRLGFGKTGLREGELRVVQIGEGRASHLVGLLRDAVGLLG